MRNQRTPGGDGGPLIGIEVAGQNIQRGSAWSGGIGGEAELTDQSRFDLQHFANEVRLRSVGLHQPRAQLRGSIHAMAGILHG